MYTKITKKLFFLGAIFVLSLASCQQKSGPENTTGYYAPPGRCLGCDSAAIGYKTDGQWYDFGLDIPYTLAISHTVDEPEKYYICIEAAVKIFVYCTIDFNLYRNLQDVDYILSIYEDENEKYKHLEEDGGWLLHEIEPEDFYSETYGYTIENNIMQYNFEEDLYLKKEITNSYHEKLFDFTTNGIYISVIILCYDIGPSGVARYRIEKQTRQIKLDSDFDNHVMKIETEY